MAYPSGYVGTSLASTASRSYSTSGFIPELWGDEVLATYESNLVLANLVSRIPFSGKKGDTIHIPQFTRGNATAKAAGVAVTLVGTQSEELPILINKHYEYSVLIEDIAALQALDSMRAMYVKDAGYALAKQVDIHLAVAGAKLSGTTTAAEKFEGAVIGGDGVTKFTDTSNLVTGAPSALTDAGIRRMIQTLDDNDIPMDGRSLIIPPVEKKNLLGIARYTEQAFVGDGSSIRTGMIGNVYGIPVYVSSNMLHALGDPDDTKVYYASSATLPTAGGTDLVGITAATSSDTSLEFYRLGFMLHKEALVLVEQQAVRTQSQYKQEYLADLFTADTVYGVECKRPEAGVVFVVPA